MSQLIKRNDNVTFVMVYLPSISNLEHDGEAHLTIERTAIAKKAGEKQVVVERNRKTSNQSSYMTSDTFLQQDVNVLNISEHIKHNPFSNAIHTTASAVFTSDVTDDEIRKQAQHWCKGVLEVYANAINKINQNLSEMVDKSDSPAMLFDEQSEAA